MKCRVNVTFVSRPWHSRINGRSVRAESREDEDEEGEEEEEEDNGRRGEKEAKGTFPRDKIRLSYRRRSTILVWGLVEGARNRRVFATRPAFDPNIDSPLSH